MHVKIKLFTASDSLLFIKILSLIVLRHSRVFMGSTSVYGKNHHLPFLEFQVS